MNIAVCLCQVPDSASVIGFADGALDRSRINEVMNPYDEYALEEAVCLKERIAGSLVTVFTVAPLSAKDMLRKALALGADRAVLVSAAEPSDPYFTALQLKSALMEFYEGILPDLVFCGKSSTDFQSAEVPSMLGALLGIASVSGVTSLNVSGEHLHLEREIEGGVEQIELHYPVVISAEKGLNQPRKTTVKAVMEARKKPIDLLAVSVDGAPLVLVSDFKALERKKVCRFAEDEKELLLLLSNECSLFSAD
ncbi:MAG: electron transfer flavoprotein subunit beta/FixA family protein [Chlorobiaceae bacterium]|nr:electron transfer flavoprotein subunit beta/FixA family protein [Chlorobiaceae bacterium]